MIVIKFATSVKTGWYQLFRFQFGLFVISNRSASNYLAWIYWIFLWIWSKLIEIQLKFWRISWNMLWKSQKSWTFGDHQNSVFLKSVNRGWPPKFGDHPIESMIISNLATYADWFMSGRWRTIHRDFKMAEDIYQVCLLNWRLPCLLDRIDRFTWYHIPNQCASVDVSSRYLQIERLPESIICLYST